MCLALCQINSCAGNITANLETILKTISEVASEQQAEMLIFPELSLPGPGAGDMMWEEGFVERCDEALVVIDDRCRQQNVAALIGTVKYGIGNGKLRNSLCLVGVGGGARFDKITLSTEDVWDEARYFESNDVLNSVWTCPQTGLQYGIAHWADRRLLAFETFHRAKVDRVILVGANAFELGAPEARATELAELAELSKVPVAFVNAVGAGDHVVFDGGSCVTLPDGTMPIACPWLAENTATWRIDQEYQTNFYPDKTHRINNPAQAVVDVLTFALRDYVTKCGFKKVLLGNSGGIDSAVVATLAVRAIGPENVITVSMPGPYTTDGTRTDSDELSERLGITQLCVPILPAFETVQSMMLSKNDRSPLSVLFNGDTSKVNKLAGENLQARLRGITLMWISNALGSETPTLLLATGNKSEAAAGYATLYGDTCGGLCLIGDLTKGLVYEVARELNREMGDVIPTSVIERAPSAELAPGQKDQDSLPPYPILDHLVREFVEGGKNVCSAVNPAMGIDAALARKVYAMIGNAEYKRKQVASCVRVTGKAFGPGRRMPLAKGKNK